MTDDYVKQRSFARSALQQDVMEGERRMSPFIRPLTAVLATIAVLSAVLIGTTPPDGSTTALPTSSTIVEVDADDIQEVASAGDCAEAVAILVPAFRARGVLAKDAKVASALGTIYSWWPGSTCGEWLAKRVVVPTICNLSSKPAWVPGRGTARWIVWFISGGQSTQCVN